MNNKEFEAIIKLPANIRYEYFIKKVADYEEVWALYDDGFVTAIDENGNKVIPFFPKKEFAQNYAKLEWAICKPITIELDDFINKWLPGMEKDEIKPAIFPVDDKMAVVEYELLIRDLETELENY